MSSNSKPLYLIIGALIVVAAGLSYYIYQQKQNESTIQLKIGDQGVKIQTN